MRTELEVRVSEPQDGLCTIGAHMGLDVSPFVESVVHAGRCYAASVKSGADQA